jgi:hypothetical protein
MYNTLRKHVLEKCASPDALAPLDSEGARMAPGVSHYSITAGVQLWQMLVVVKLPAIPNEETPATVQVMVQLPISKAKNTIDTKMDNIMKAFEA